MSLPVRPSKDLEFASGGSAAIIEPSAAKKQLGWIAELPPFQYFNWFWNLVWQWQLFIDRRIIRTDLVTAAGALVLDTSRCRRIHFDATVGPQSVTLPAIVTADNDLTFELKKVDSTANLITITGTVEGEVNPTIDYQFTGRAVYAYGGAWYWAK